MKAKRSENVTITVELTEKEATVLCALAGGVVWNFDGGEASGAVYDFFTALNETLPNRQESFSDFFAGKVETLP